MIKLLVFCLLLVGVKVKAVEIATVTWPTKHASPVARLEGAKQLILPMVRLGANSVAEAKVMRLAFLGGRTLGLDVERAGELHELVTRRYQKFEDSELFKELPSALPYCYSGQRPKHGLAGVYRPDGASEKTPTILFLHGFGGSFQLYQAVMAEAFPNHLIIFPAFGMSPAKVSGDYLKECFAAVSKEMGFELSKPLLVGLSAGGIGGFREYTQNVDRYRGLIVLGAFPPKEVRARLPRDGSLRILAGAKEGFVVDQTLQRAAFQIRGRVKDYKHHLLPKQGHFFLLAAEGKTMQILKNWEAEMR